MEAQLKYNSGICPAIIVFLAAVSFSAIAWAGGEELEQVDESAAFRTRLEEHFTAERVDAEWAPTVENEFQEHVRSAVEADRESPLATAEIRGFVCRAATCKVEVTLTAPGDFRTLMTELNERIPWDHTAEWFLVSTDPAVMVGYIAREDADMPRDSRQPSMH